MNKFLAILLSTSFLQLAISAEHIINFNPDDLYFSKKPDSKLAPLQLRLGDIHGTGKDGQQDLLKALKWYKKAAHNGSVEAMNRIAELHHLGIGFEIDLGLAKTWYQRAADQGHLASLVNLGNLHLQSSTPSIGIGYLAKAAELGHSESYITVADYYYFKKSRSDFDIINALKNYGLAAQNNLASGQLKFGVMLNKGIGIKINKILSYAWLDIAKHNGNKVALAYLAQIDKQYNIAEFEQARIAKSALIKKHSLRLTDKTK